MVFLLLFINPLHNFSNPSDALSGRLISFYSLFGLHCEGIFLFVVTFVLQDGVNTKRGDNSSIEICVGRDLCNDATD